MKNASVLKNIGRHGGVLRITGSKISVINGIFRSNRDYTSSEERGGTFFLDTSTVDLQGTEFAENESQDNRGAINMRVSTKDSSRY